MAYKIVHRTLGQQVLFADRGSARRYAERYGGRRRWYVIEAGAPVPAPMSPPVPLPRGGAETGVRPGWR